MYTVPSHMLTQASIDAKALQAQLRLRHQCTCACPSVHMARIPARLQRTTFACSQAGVAVLDMSSHAAPVHTPTCMHAHVPGRTDRTHRTCRILVITICP